MTVVAIKQCLAKAGKPVETAQVYRYLKRLKISQLGFRQRPANYPEDTAERILASLGRNGVQVLSFKALKKGGVA